MLTPVEIQKLDGSSFRFAVVAARYNERYVQGMLDACLDEFKGARAKVDVARVPGSFEIPAVASHFSSSGMFNAVVCMGVIFQGETKHADHIGSAVSNALAQLQIEHKVPVIHCVQLFLNEEQARIRCLEKEHNRGTEAGRVALQMAHLMQSL